MLHLKKGLGMLVLLIGLSLPLWAQNSQTVDITATIPSMDDLSVSISRIDADTGQWFPGQSSIDFGTLTFDTTYNIFRADSYYAVDVGILSNASNWTIQHQVTSVVEPNSGANLDSNINVSFVQQLDDTTSNSLADVSYANSNRTFLRSQIVPGWLRIYYGIGTGSGDNPGVVPIGTDKPSGTYTGQITLTLTTS